METTSDLMLCQSFYELFYEPEENEEIYDIYNKRN